MRTLEQLETNQDLLINKLLKERLKTCSSLLVDLDNTLFPVATPSDLDVCITSIGERLSLIPCTSRSWGEMLEEDYPGKNSLINSPLGIYEAGIVIKTKESFQLLCSEQSINQLIEMKEIIKNKLSPIGRRSKNNLYELDNAADDPWAWGYLESCLENDFIRKKTVPLIIPPYPEQFSLIIWPSGSLRDCPSERFFYSVCLFLDGLRVGRPDLFENMSILIGDESILVRPNDQDGSQITKLSAVKFLESAGLINPSQTLFMGNDDRLDLEVAQYISKKNGVVIVPSNADDEIKRTANLVAPGFAGNALLPILTKVGEIKNG